MLVIDSYQREKMATANTAHGKYAVQESVAIMDKDGEIESMLNSMGYMVMAPDDEGVEVGHQEHLQQQDGEAKSRLSPVVRYRSIAQQTDRDDDESSEADEAPSNIDTGLLRATAEEEMESAEAERRSRKNEELIDELDDLLRIDRNYGINRRMDEGGVGIDTGIDNGEANGFIKRSGLPASTARPPGGSHTDGHLQIGGAPKHLVSAPLEEGVRHTVCDLASQVNGWDPEWVLPEGQHSTGRRPTDIERRAS